MLVKKTSKNQITLPKEIVKEFPETEYFDIIVKEAKIILKPVKIRPNMTIEGVKEKLEKLGIIGSDVAKAIKWARKTKRV